MKSLPKERGNVARKEREKEVKKEIEAEKGKRARKENEAKIKLEITEIAVRIKTEAMMAKGK